VKTRTAAGAALALAAALFPLSARAYRPLTTEDAGVVGKGKLQLESSWDRLSMPDREIEDYLLLVPSYGLTERLEAAVALPFVLLKPEEEARRGGLGDVMAYFKFQAVKEDGHRPALTALASWRSDSGKHRHGLGAGYRELGLFGVGSKDLGRFQLNAMAGEAFAFGQDEDIRDAFQYGTSLDYRLVEIKRRPLFLLSEILGGENPDRSREEWRATWFWGLLFEPTPRLAFDIGIGWGLEDVSPRWRTTLGATCTF